MRGKTELVEEIIFPSLLDSRAQITEDIQEMQSQLSKQTDRIRELRIKKIEEPGKFSVDLLNDYQLLNGYPSPSSLQMLFMELKMILHYMTWM